MKTNSKLTTIFGSLVIAGLMAASPPHGRSDAKGMGSAIAGAGVLAYVVAYGAALAIAGTVMAIKAASKDNSRNDASGVTAPPDAAKNNPVAGAQPLCKDVGGYESYVKRTRKLCRLY